jgi:hypothetical protein
MPMKGNYSTIMSSCCSSASVVEYDGCDFYCLAQGQTVDLAECLIKASEPGQVWCNTNANATATATEPTTGTEIITLSATTTGTDSTSSATSSSAAASSTASAAGSVVPHPVSKSAVGMVVLLLAGSAAGYFV